MGKLLYFATIGMLAFSIGGCGGDGGGNTASPTPSPTVSPGAASPSPAAGSPGTPGAAASPTPGAQTFPSPVVAAQPPGLIRSTNPDERARQAQAGIDAKKTAPDLNGTAIPQTPIPGQANDPFSILPPQPLRTDGGTQGNELPKLPAREVPNLPDLPDDSNPPQWTPGQRFGAPGGDEIAELPETQSPVQVSSLPNLPLTPIPQWRSPGFPDLAASPASIPGLPPLPASPRGTPGPQPAPPRA